MNYFKFKIIALICLIFSGNIFAQNISIYFSNNPSPYISDWRDKKEMVLLTIINPGTKDLSVKIKTELYDGNGVLVAFTDASKMPVINILAGQTNSFNAEDMFPVYAIKYKGNMERTTSQTGRIPDDNYKICVTLTDPQTGTQIGTSATVCRMFSILAYQAPVLLTPIDNDTIPENKMKGIIFRWGPVSPYPKMIVTYRLQIFEVQPGQTSMIAMRANRPILEKDLPGILQTQWPIDFAPATPGMKYVWTITALDNDERKLVDGNGFAQPFSFEVMEEKRDTVIPSPASDENNVEFTDTLFFKDLYETLSKVKTNSNSLSPEKLQDLIGLLTLDSLGKEDMKTVLTEFYKLNASDLETVLADIRKSKFIYQYDKDHPDNLKYKEETVKEFCKELNFVSTKKYGVPFHLAALKKQDNEFTAQYNKFFGGQDSGSLRSPDCLQAYYPYYKGGSSPWRLTFAADWGLRYRVEDYGCNFHLSGYGGTIRNWVTPSALVVAMIYSNGWGGPLAASNNCFFVKKWTCIPLGLGPYHLIALLWARKQ